MLEIVLPFGLPPDELAKDLIASLRTPALARLLACARAHGSREFDGFNRSLPHEQLLDETFGPALRNAAGLLQNIDPARTGYWFILHPVHLHIARDHLVLTDTRQLPLTDEESRALFASAAPVFQESGMTLLYGDGRRWLLQADAWSDMQTATLDAACGHNVEIWMPKGSQARAWRKLQNEVQMTWFEQEVNLARLTRGLPVVNSLWLADGAQIDAPASVSTQSGAISAPGSSAKTDLQLLLASSQNTGQWALPEQSSNCMLYADTLIGPALGGDWSDWLNAMQALDQQWFAPLLAASRLPLRLTLGHNHALREFSCNKLGLLQFWRKNGLARLLP